MKIVECQNCGKQTTKSHCRYNESVKNGWKIYCSIKCRYAHQEKGVEFFCAWCSKLIIKTPAEIRKTKTNVFCTKSCAAYYNNRHKKTGTRRSKLECYLEHQLKLNFPALDFSCNVNQIIGLELDFYFPELRLAIELNGILHYQPIYGSEKLNRIQELDKVKAQKCAEAKIKLCVVNNSTELHLTQKIKEKNWKTVKELVTSAKKRADYTTSRFP